VWLTMHTSGLLRRSVTWQVLCSQPPPTLRLRPRTLVVRAPGVSEEAPPSRACPCCVGVGDTTALQPPCDAFTRREPARLSTRSKPWLKNDQSVGCVQRATRVRVQWPSLVSCGAWRAAGVKKRREEKRAGVKACAGAGDGAPGEDTAQALATYLLSTQGPVGQLVEVRAPCAPAGLSASHGSYA
jgi:hypothetical protein